MSFRGIARYIFVSHGTDHVQCWMRALAVHFAAIWFQQGRDSFSRCRTLELDRGLHQALGGPTQLNLSLIYLSKTVCESKRPVCSGCLLAALANITVILP